MKEEYVELPLIRNDEGSRFEMKVDGMLALIEFRQTRDRITLIHTEVEPALEGKGAGTAIIEKTLRYIEDNHLKLIPVCPLVVAYLKRHPEWNRLKPV